MSDESIGPLRQEFLRRVGRNLWCYQQVEGLLKAILTISAGALPLRDGESALVEHRLAQRTRTLGQLVSDTGKGPLAAVSALREPPLDWLAWSTRFEAEAGFSAGLMAGLNQLVGERNTLVHHAPEHWNLDDPASVQTGLKDLDEQRDRIEAMHTALQRVLRTVQQAAQALVEYMQSPEFADAWRKVHLDACLTDAVLRAARADGWTDLADAGRLFKEHIARLPEPQRTHLPRFGRLLADSGLVEVREEPTPGGARWLARLHSTSN